MQAGTKSDPARVVSLSSGLHFRGKLDWDALSEGRVITVLNNSNFDGMKAYSNSNLLNVVFANELQTRINKAASFAGLVTSTSVHPGVIHTGLHREDPDHAPIFHMFYKVIVRLVGKSVTQGIQTSIYAAISNDLRGVGSVYLSDCAVKTPNPEAQQPFQGPNGAKLWDLSVNLLKKAGARASVEHFVV